MRLWEAQDSSILLMSGLQSRTPCATEADLKEVNPNTAAAQYRKVFYLIIEDKFCVLLESMRNRCISFGCFTTVIYFKPVPFLRSSPSNIPVVDNYIV